MEQVLQQLQQLNSVYTQLLTSINAQQQHLKLLIHLLQMQQQQTDLNNPSNNNEISNQFVADGINGFISSYQQLSSALNNLSLSNVEEGITSNHLTSSNTEEEFVSKHLSLSNKEKGMATNHLTPSNTEKEIAPTHLSSSNKEKGMVTNHSVSSNVQEGMASNNFINSKTPQTIDINKMSMGSLRVKIKELIVKCSRNSAMAAAKILVELYKNPKQTHSSLVKISGLSIGGLSKHIAMLKRRGFIVRTAYQQYELTHLALQLLSNSVNTNA